MSTKKTSNALTVPQRAALALGYNEETRKQLVELAAGSAHIVEITNPDGYKQVHAARMKLRNTRIEIEKRGKDAREDAQAFSKAVIAEQDALIRLIKPEEARLNALQVAHDEAIEREKRERAEAEERRTSGIRQRIAEIRGTTIVPFGAAAKDIGTLISGLECMTVDESFEEFEAEARDAKVSAITALQAMHEQAVKREAAEEEARKNAEELARLRAEADERKRRDEAEERGRAMVAGADVRQAEVEQQPIVARQVAPIAAEPSVTVHFAQPKRERPTFEEIVQIVAFQYDVDPDEVRTWICEAVVMQTEAA